MKISTILASVVLVCVSSVAFTPLQAEQDNSESRPKIQIAILLDTSSSMTGLIDQARKHLWTIVNQFIDADFKGQEPLLEVALLEYGAGRLDADAGYTRLVVPLTTNLDQVYEDLVQLTAVGRPGGSLESCGQIIDMAVHKLAWDETGVKCMKCIFIAGNESFTQGPVDFHKACLESIEDGITVNTIFCGDHQEGIRLRWKEGANVAEGVYLSIDHNHVARATPTPHDKPLAELNSALNRTYLPYGDREARRASITRQVQQDETAAALAASSSADRIRFKGSALYRNEGWDLIDGVKNGRVELSKLKDDQLPESLRKMTLEERDAHVKELTQQRAKLQAEIKALSQKRDKFLETQAQDAGAAPVNRFDQALIEAVKQQSEKQGIKLKK